MRNIFTAALMPVLAALAIGCTSTTALQTTETDDLYYASTDKTMRQETGVPPTETASSGSSNEYAAPEGTAANPEYYGPETIRTTSVSNNYYYDDDRYYTSRSRRNYI